MTRVLHRTEPSIGAVLFRRGVIFWLVAILAAAAAPVSADECISMRGARIYASDFGTQGFKVSLNDGAHPSARLFTFDLKGKEKTVWTAKLLNIPTDVYVADDRPMVVAISSGPCTASREHAVVMYGSKGAVLADYRLFDLLSKEDVNAHVESSISGASWAEDARFRFDYQANQVVIALAWGRQIRLDLATGRLASVDK